MNPAPSSASTPKPRSGPFIRNDLARLSFFCVIVGIVAGLGAIAFYWLLELSHYAFLEQVAGYHAPGADGEPRLLPPSHAPFRRWALLFLPAFGGLTGGYIVYKFAPEAAGHGTDAAIESYHFKEGRVRSLSVPIVKTIASALTIGTGGSAGREGPIAQIGSAMGSILATRLGLSPAERRILLSAGMAAGIGAIFHAPLAAAIFAAEILYKDMDLEHEVLAPSFISSIVAYSIFALKFGWSPIFVTPPFVFTNPLQLVPYLALAAVVALGAILYVKVFYGVHSRFTLLRVPAYLKPAIGGLAVGLIGFFIPQALGAGYGVLQQAFFNQIPAFTLLTIAFFKILTTSFTVGSGGSGGVFGPGIVIGGALGGAVGQLAAALLPHLDINPGAFVLVGMAGFFAAAANVPISTLIMVSEMTGNYHLLVPSMLVCITAYLFARKHTLYEMQLQSRLEAPTKMANMLSAVLRKLKVRQSLAPAAGTASLPPVVTIREDTPLGVMIYQIAEADQETFPVLNAEGHMTGVIAWEDIRRVLGDEQTVADLIVASDLLKPAVTVTIDENLLNSVRKMTRSEVHDLVVVNDEVPPRPIAILSHDAVIRTYDAAVFGQTTTVNNSVS